MTQNEGTYHAIADIPENHIRIEDKLYSTKKLAEIHPGGPLFIKVQVQVYLLLELDQTIDMPIYETYAGILRP